MARGGLHDGHPRHPHCAVGRAEGDDPLGLDQEEAVDWLVGQRPHHADLQHVVDVDAVGRPRHQLQHLDGQQVGRFDAVGGQRHHAQLPRRLQRRRHRLLHHRLVEVHGMTARQTARHQDENQQSSLRAGSRHGCFPYSAHAVCGNPFVVLSWWDCAALVPPYGCQLSDDWLSAQATGKLFPFNAVRIIGRVERGLCIVF